MKHARDDYNRIQDPAGRIPDDEPVFLLRGQDVLAAAIVRAYANSAALAGSHEIARVSMEWADNMDAWRESHGGGKLPDM